MCALSYSLLFGSLFVSITRGIASLRWWQSIPFDLNSRQVNGYPGIGPMDPTSYKNKTTRTDNEKRKCHRKKVEHQLDEQQKKKINKKQITKIRAYNQSVEWRSLMICSSQLALTRRTFFQYQTEHVSRFPYFGLVWLELTVHHLWSFSWILVHSLLAICSVYDPIQLQRAVSYFHQDQSYQIS